MIEELFRFILEFLRTDVFVSFGLLSIPFLILRQIPKTRKKAIWFDDMASRFIVFCGVVFTVVVLLFQVYFYFFREDYDLWSRATGPYAWSYWLSCFSWLLITQSFRFKLVRRNIVIRLITIPFFIITIEQYIIILRVIDAWRSIQFFSENEQAFSLWDILSQIPYWPLHLLLKLGLFMGYVYLFYVVTKKIKKLKAQK